MYHGEVNVADEDPNTFLAVAEKHTNHQYQAPAGLIEAAYLKLSPKRSELSKVEFTMSQKYNKDSCDNQTLTHPIPPRDNLPQII
jgi:hypothetical protein